MIYYEYRKKGSDILKHYFNRERFLELLESKDINQSELSSLAKIDRTSMFYKTTHQRSFNTNEISTISDILELTNDDIVDIFIKSKKD